MYMYFNVQVYTVAWSQIGPVLDGLLHSSSKPFIIQLSIVLSDVVMYMYMMYIYR